MILGQNVRQMRPSLESNSRNDFEIARSSACSLTGQADPPTALAQVHVGMVWV